ncbi:MAG: ribosome assembly factor SBDS [Candidatus Nanoarchaeia archaeon]
MASADKSCIIRYKKAGVEVEALVEYRELVNYLEQSESENSTQEQNSIYDVFVTPQLYSDSNKGLEADYDTIKQLFEKMSEEEILIEIARHGDAQIPTSYMNELREKKKEQIINYIASQTINPQTKQKYSQSLISNEIESLTFTVHPYKDHIKQAEDIFKELKKKIPIKFDNSLLIIQIPSQYSGKLIGTIRKFGTIEKQFYDELGVLHLHLNIPTSRLEEVETFVKNETNGSGSYYVHKDE